MDAFTLAIIVGMCSRKKEFQMALTVGILFGIFQGVMPIIGFYLGRVLHDFIALNSWVSFIILLIIGIKMIWESLKKEAHKTEIKTTLTQLFIFAIISSIDALAVGFSLAFMGVHIIKIALIIGVVTLIFSFFGVYIGTFFQKFFGKKMELIGGIILIVIAFKCL